MSLTEQNYREWCDRMAAKAALEQSSSGTAGPVRTTDTTMFQSRDVSDIESFHSSHSRPLHKSAESKPSRRRTISDPKAPSTENIFYQARTGTWPRSARSSVSHQTSQQRSAVPRRRCSIFSTSSRRRPDLVAFHRESCQLFSSMDQTVTDSGYSSVHRPGSSRIASTASFQQISTPAELSPRCSTSVARPPLATVMSWKSDQTRRIEYSKIDDAHSGLRGFCKKVLPKRCQSSRSWRRFFDGKCDGDSVRRVRMPFSDDVDEAGS